jgi:nucleotide-binding universal stress UspA family protein
VAAGPIVVGFDGSPAAEHAVRETGALLRGRRALVVVVWKQGVGMELVELPASTIGLPPAAIDIRTALEIEQALAERAQMLAQKGAGLAREAGFAEPEGLAVADDVDTPIAETLVNVAAERDAEALAVGAHGHGRLGEMFLGSVSRDVIRRSTRPVVVVREQPGQTG